MFNGIYILHSDGREVWTPVWPLWPHDLVLSAWCLHQSRYLKKSPWSWQYSAAEKNDPHTHTL